MMVQVPLIRGRRGGQSTTCWGDGTARGRRSVSHLEPTGRKNPVERAGRPGRDEWKRWLFQQFGMRPGEGLLHGHACAVRRDTSSRPRPELLRRPVGLGAGHHGEGAQPRLLKDVVGKIWKVLKGPRDTSRAFPEAEGPAHSRPSEGARLPPREDLLRSNPDLPRSSARRGSCRSIRRLIIASDGSSRTATRTQMRAAATTTWVTEDERVRTARCATA